MEGKGSGHSTQVKRVTRCTWRFMEGGAEPPREESLPLNGRVRRIVCKKPLCARLLAVSACGSRSPPASHSSTWPLTSSGASACGSSVLSGIAALTFTACLRLHACPSVTSHLTALPPSLPLVPAVRPRVSHACVLRHCHLSIRPRWADRQRLLRVPFHKGQEGE